MERKSSLIYIVFVFIIILVLLFYYITSVRNPPQSVNIVNLNTSSLYNLSFTVTPTFNLYSGQLYLLIKVINRGNKTITYSSGCVSPFSGNVNPNSTATLSYLKNTATCYTIALQSLKANQSAVLIWPHSPEFIRVIRNGEFAVNLTFPFGYYGKDEAGCISGNISCNSSSYVFVTLNQTATLNMTFNVT
ncbi:MAG: hypothetical protein BJBARM5_0519 [Candidatus Parvarchaeum acidophilus ARMAN-5]|jgi:hypothetical protein|uniref:Uncharacterized protein n=1 Tax=Candidatus Parvarchaeum acidophilus ARMAN-5 TaxID=662762 RepID=D6GVK6_PARA5|nr:MAG: hypothetical protein BJBARM5_0519 [Candidatus Parvarchaeum acidophilus ARMAN-5]